jgi:hypothetical protein
MVLSVQPITAANSDTFFPPLLLTTPSDTKHASLPSPDAVFEPSVVGDCWTPGMYCLELSDSSKLMAYLLRTNVDFARFLKTCS